MDTRVKTYYRLDTKTQVTEKFDFDSAHYLLVGLRPTPEFGMARSEALELINRWNKISIRCAYYIL